MKNFEFNFEADLSNLDSFTYADLAGADLLEIETDKYTKHYERVGGKWELYVISDKNGNVTELTPIPDYKTTYADLENGRIWNDLRNDFSKASKPNYYGYIYSSFEGQPVALHVLMMSAYTQKKPSEWRKQDLEIDHINGDKTDNRCGIHGQCNLRLVTRQQQYDERVRTKMSENAGTPLTKEQVQYIKYITAIVKAKGKKVDSKLIHLLADKYGKRYETIRKAVSGVTHASVEMSKAMQQEVRKIELENDLEQLGLIA